LTRKPGRLQRKYQLKIETDRDVKEPGLIASAAEFFKALVKKKGWAEVKSRGDLRTAIKDIATQKRGYPTE
jgi:hypothetical protein